MLLTGLLLLASLVLPMSAVSASWHHEAGSALGIALDGEAAGHAQETAPCADREHASGGADDCCLAPHCSLAQGGFPLANGPTLQNPPGDALSSAEAPRLEGIGIETAFRPPRRAV